MRFSRGIFFGARPHARIRPCWRPVRRDFGVFGVVAAPTEDAAVLTRRPTRRDTGTLRAWLEPHAIPKAIKDTIAGVAPWAVRHPSPWPPDCAAASKWDPRRFCAMSLNRSGNQRSSGVPIGADRNPIVAKLARYINMVSGAMAGPHFGANPHPGRPDPLSARAPVAAAAFAKVK
jgi:hypothetical protein